MTVDNVRPISGYFPPPPSPADEAEKELEVLEALLADPSNPPSPKELNQMIQQIDADYRELQNDPTFQHDKAAQALFAEFYKLFPNAGSKEDIANFLASLKNGTNAKLISEIALYIANISHGTVH